MATGETSLGETGEVESVKLEFTLSIDGSIDRLVRLPVPWEDFEVLYAAIQNIGYGRVMGLIDFALGLIAKLHSLGVTDPENAFEEFWSDMGKFVQTGVTVKDLEDVALHFTYDLLRHRLISRPEAAIIAASMLRSTTTISTDAWRLKVDRWALRNKLGPVGIRQRRKQ